LNQCIILLSLHALADTLNLRVQRIRINFLVIPDHVDHVLLELVHGIHDDAEVALYDLHLRGIGLRHQTRVTALVPGVGGLLNRLAAFAILLLVCGRATDATHLVVFDSVLGAHW
jgi:hypothetical protein